MKKLILALSATLFLAGTAFAGTAEGVIKEYNKETKVILLEDGKSFTVGADIAVPAELAVGKKVVSTLDGDDMTKVTLVTLSPPM